MCLVVFSLLVAGVAEAQQANTFVVKLPQLVEQSVEPLYPAAAWADKLIGNGAADVRVDERGFPTTVRLISWQNLNKEGDARGLDEATLAAIRRWRFKPLFADGRSVPYNVRVGFVVRPEGISYVTVNPERQYR
jgi:outer membrane biosynthesis protein TonB